MHVRLIGTGQDIPYPQHTSTVPGLARRILLAGLLWLLVHGARAEIVWHWEDSFSGDERSRLTAWIEETVAGVENLVAPYPFDVHVRFYRADPGGSPVPWANTIRSRRQGVNFHVDPARSTAELLDDWTAPHELSHLLIPWLGRDHAWFAEGFASFMQYQVMHAMHRVDDEEMTARYRSRIDKARRGYDLDDTPFIDAAAELVARRQYPTMYWGGAVYFLQVDRRLRQNGGSVPRVLGQFVKCCRMQTSGLEALVDELDRIAGEPAFSEQLEQLRARRGFPDSDAIWTEQSADRPPDGEPDSLTSGDR